MYLTSPSYRQTQWDPPSSWDGVSEDSHSLDHEAEMDLGTPTYDENPSKVTFDPENTQAKAFQMHPSFLDIITS